jgi:hypothetical protein
MAAEEDFVTLQGLNYSSINKAGERHFDPLPAVKIIHEF